MLHSWANFKEEIVLGNDDTGYFDLCLGINHKSEEYEAIKGQHCMIQYYTIPNETIHRAFRSSLQNFGWIDQHKRYGGAVCLPLSCEPEIARNLMSKIFEGTKLSVAKDYNQNEYCRTTETKRMNSAAYALM